MRKYNLLTRINFVLISLLTMLLALRCNPNEISIDIKEEKTSLLTIEFQNLQKELQDLQKEYDALIDENRIKNNNIGVLQNQINQQGNKNLEILNNSEKINEEILILNEQVEILNKEIENRNNQLQKILSSKEIKSLLNNIEKIKLEVEATSEDIKTLKQNIYLETSSKNIKDGWYQVNRIGRRQLKDIERGQFIINSDYIFDPYDSYIKIEKGIIVNRAYIDPLALSPLEEQFNLLAGRDIYASEVVIIVGSYPGYRYSDYSKEDLDLYERTSAVYNRESKRKNICQYYNLESTCINLLSTSLLTWPTTELVPVENINVPTILLRVTNKQEPRPYSDGQKTVISYQADITEQVATYIDEFPYPTQFNFTSNRGFKKDPIYSQIERNDPTSYFKAFIKDAARHGVDLSHIEIKNFTINVVKDFPCPDGSVFCFGGILATASGVCNDDIIEINILERIWKYAPAFDYYDELIQIIWHELGHDILNLNHVCEPYHILSSIDDGILYDNPEKKCNIIPAGKTHTLSFRYDHPNEELNWQRAVKDMFTKHRQVLFECNPKQEKKLHKHTRADGTVFWH